MPFGIHWIYLVIILVIILIVFGVGRLPEVGGALGRGIRNFRDSAKEDPKPLGPTETENSPPPKT